MDGGPATKLVTGRRADARPRPENLQPATLVSETDEYVLEQLRHRIWSGFYSAGDVREMLDDSITDNYGEDEPCDEEALRASVDAELERKRRAEAAWPATTDCDRLGEVFRALHEEGICALHNAGYTSSDGHGEVDDFVDKAPSGRYHGFCFYHDQDVERAVDRHGLLLAFGDLQDDDEASAAVGRTIAVALREAGLAVAWNGSVRTRIDLPSIDWQRRSPD